MRASAIHILLMRSVSHGVGLACRGRTLAHACRAHYMHTSHHGSLRCARLQPVSAAEARLVTHFRMRINSTVARGYASVQPLGAYLFVLMVRVRRSTGYHRIRAHAYVCCIAYSWHIRAEIARAVQTCARMKKERANRITLPYPLPLIVRARSRAYCRTLAKVAVKVYMIRASTALVQPFVAEQL